MEYVITDKQSKILEKHILDSITFSLESLKEESMEWGLGEMDELDEINSIEKITIDRITFSKGIKVYINIFSNSDREEFENVSSEIEYRLGQLFPNIELFINELIRK